MKKPVYQRLYFQVLAGIVLGVLMGCFFPETAMKLKPLGDAFIRLIKMMVAPIIFVPLSLALPKWAI